jgi:hypothetical protein
LGFGLGAHPFFAHFTERILELGDALGGELHQIIGILRLGHWLHGLGGGGSVLRRWRDDFGGSVEGSWSVSIIRLR